MKKSILLFAVILVSLFACTKSSDDLTALEVTNQAVDSRGDNPKERPFKATGTYSLVNAGNPCDGGYEVEFAGSGTTSHMGQTTTSFLQCYNVTTGCAEGDNTFIAANGDELYGHYTVCFAGYNEDYTLQFFSGTGTITGGTGRFENASGTTNSWISQIIDPNEPNFRGGEYSSTGTIVY